MNRKHKYDTEAPAYTMSQDDMAQRDFVRSVKDLSTLDLERQLTDNAYLTSRTEQCIESAQEALTEAKNQQRKLLMQRTVLHQVLETREI